MFKDKNFSSTSGYLLIHNHIPTKVYSHPGRGRGQAQGDATSGVCCEQPRFTLLALLKDGPDPHTPVNHPAFFFFP